jgi:hypothetical protein
MFKELLLVIGIAAVVAGIVFLVTRIRENRRNPPPKRLGPMEWDASEIRFLPEGKKLGFHLPMAEIDVVEVHTTDRGPFYEDAFLVLTYSDAKEMVSIPSESPQCDALIKHIQQWPGFDHQTFGAAMRCTDYRQFVVWKKVK